MMSATRPFRLLAIALAVGAGAPAAAQTTGVCQRRPNCAEVTSFVAAVSDFRTSQQDRGTRLVTATVRILNKLTRPLTLGYVAGSGVVTDDQGNRFTIYSPESVRGIGEIRANTFDPKFTLQSAEASDARFEFAFQIPSQTTILGTRYEIELTLREIDPVTGSQYRLGREHALRFGGFTSGGIAAADAPASATPAVASVPVSSPPPPVADPCAGRSRCSSAGPFVANLTQLVSSVEGNHMQVLRSTVAIRNVTNTPIILAYKARSNIVVDNVGNRYAWGRAGTYDNSVTGMGKVEGASADPQFVLSPGESRNVVLTSFWQQGRGKEVGTVFTQDFTVSQLEILPSRQVRVGRDYVVSFRDLQVGASDDVRATANDGAKKLLDAFKRKIQKP